MSGEAYQHPFFLRDIVSQKHTPEGFATEVKLSCGHSAILFGNLTHLVAMYGRLACHCADCMSEEVKRRAAEDDV